MPYPNESKLRSDGPRDESLFTSEEAEALEFARQECAELLIEALEECLRDGSWIPGKGIVSLEDSDFDPPPA